jgi:hypothetical protein
VGGQRSRGFVIQRVRPHARSPHSGNGLPVSCAVAVAIKSFDDYTDKGPLWTCLLSTCSWTVKRWAAIAMLHSTSRRRCSSSPGACHFRSVDSRLHVAVTMHTPTVGACCHYSLLRRAGHSLCSRDRPLWCFCRSCEAGLQAGAAKCQTLTIFASRRAVENFIETHVRDVIIRYHTCSAKAWWSSAIRMNSCFALLFYDWCLQCSALRNYRHL